jgi:hypothetical protein
VLAGGELTDGEWIWPDTLPHYVERHGVMLPEELIASAAARGWKAPPIEQVGSKLPSALLYHALRMGEVPPPGEMAARVQCERDYSAWLEWAKALPEIAEIQPYSDPGVFERFSLVLRYAETDDPDEQMKAFDNRVWDQLGARYGRRGPAVADQSSIEWIPVKHRDTVVAFVRDGLRRYGLTERVKLIYREPDPHDWQRDRDITLWPLGGAAEPAAADGTMDVKPRLRDDGR